MNDPDLDLDSRLRRAFAAAAASVDDTHPALTPTGSVPLRPNRSGRVVLRSALAVLVLGLLAVAFVAVRSTDEAPTADDPTVVPEAGWDPERAVCTPSALDDGGYYGTGPLAVLPPIDAATGRVPGDAYEGGLYVKMAWRRDRAGAMAIEVERLDGEGVGRAEIPDGYPETGMQPTGIIVNGPGCWRITGHLDDVSISFVVDVVPQSDDSSG